MAKSARNPKPRSRKGMLPNQYRRRSTVYVERLRAVDETQRYGEDDLYTTDAYIVITTRTDDQWVHTVELRGEIIRLPGKVFDRIAAQRDQVVKEARQERGRRTHEAMKAKGLAEADQVEASQEDAEREADLRGL